MCHMTILAKSAPAKPSSKDFTLHFLSDQTSEEDLRAALRKRWSWVVSSPRPTALWYSLIIDNLHQTHNVSRTATMDFVRQAINDGIKRSAFDRLKQLTQTSRETLGEVVRIPARTLSRRDVFHPDESERILRVAAAFQRAIEVFEDLDKARRWFSTPRRALNDKTPMRFCDTEVGANEVMHLLGRIEHGVFS